MTVDVAWPADDRPWETDRDDRRARTEKQTAHTETFPAPREWLESRKDPR